MPPGYTGEGPVRHSDRKVGYLSMALRVKESSQTVPDILVYSHYMSFTPDIEIGKIVHQFLESDVLSR